MRSSKITSNTENCPLCANKLERNALRCPSCDKLIAADSSTGETSKVELPYFRGSEFTLVHAALFFVCAINFMLGIMEGFWSNNSLAMALNFAVSLLVLAITAGIPKYAYIVITSCFLLNLIHHFCIYHLTLASVKDWLSLRMLLFVIPIAALIFKLLEPQSRRFR